MRILTAYSLLLCLVALNTTCGGRSGGSEQASRPDRRIDELTKTIREMVEQRRRAGMPIALHHVEEMYPGVKRHSDGSVSIDGQTVFEPEDRPCLETFHVLKDRYLVMASLCGAPGDSSYYYMSLYPPPTGEVHIASLSSPSTLYYADLDGHALVDIDESRRILYVWDGKEDRVRELPITPVPWPDRRSRILSMSFDEIMSEADACEILIPWFRVHDPSEIVVEHPDGHISIEGRTVFVPEEKPCPITTHMFRGKYLVIASYCDSVGIDSSHFPEPRNEILLAEIHRPRPADYEVDLEGCMPVNIDKRRQVLFVWDFDQKRVREIPLTPRQK